MKHIVAENIEPINKENRESGTQSSLSHVLLLLLGARSFFLIIGVAFLFSKVTEMLLFGGEIIVRATIEAAVISFICPAIVWASTKWGEGVVKEASVTHKQLVAANETAQREIAERKSAENALLESEERSQRLAQEYLLLAEIGRIISSSLNTNDVYEAFAERVRNLISFDSISISTIDYTNSSLTIAYLSGLITPKREVGTSTPLQGTLSEYVADRRSGAIIDVSDADTLERELPGLIPTFNAGFKSVLAAPLISKDQPIGAIQFRSKTPGAYSQRHVMLAESVAAQVAGAVANSQLHAQRVAAEEALRQSEWRYRHMVESASDIVYTTDANGYFSYINRPASRLTEYPEEELIGRHFTELIARGWKHRVQRFYISQLHRRLGETLLEFPVVTRSGAIRWIEQSVVPLESDGMTTGFEGIGRDVTKRKQVEAEREKLIAELQEAIAKINTLSGLLPICASCKKIRDDKGYWNQIESFIRDHSEADFSHGICPECAAQVYLDLKNSSRSARK